MVKPAGMLIRKRRSYLAMARCIKRGSDTPLMQVLPANHGFDSQPTPPLRYPILRNGRMSHRNNSLHGLNLHQKTPKLEDHVSYRNKRTSSLCMAYSTIDGLNNER